MSITVEVRTPPAIAVEVVEDNLVIEVAQPPRVDVQIGGEVGPTGATGAPGSFTGLNIYYLDDYGGGSSKTAAENNAALALILTIGGSSSKTWYEESGYGGVVGLKRGEYRFSGVWVIPNHWGFRGQGHGLSALVRVDGTGQLSFSTRTGSGYRMSDVGGFTIDGASIASSTPLLYMGKMGEGTVDDVMLVNGGSHGWLLEATQNVTYTNCNAQLNTGSGIVLDYGAGGNLFQGCEYNQNGRYGIEFASNGPYPGSGTPGTPTALNKWVGGRCERGTGTTLGMIYAGSGIGNQFIGFTLAFGEATSNVALLVFRVDSGMQHDHLEFASCRWYGNPTYVSAIDATGAGSLYLSGVQTFASLVASPLSINSAVTFGAGRVNGLTVMPEQSNILTRFLAALRITRNVANDNALNVFLAGEANARFRLLGDGTLSWGPGSSGSDINLHRSGGALGARLRCDQVLSAGTGAVGTGLRIGDGDVIRQHLTATVANDVQVVGPGGIGGLSVALPGALPGDIAVAAFGQVVPLGLIVWAHVAGADQVNVYISNPDSVPHTIAAGTLRASVWKY